MIWSGSLLRKTLKCSNHTDVRMVKKIKVAVVGIGNCFSGLIQGIEYDKQNPSQEVIGIIHAKLRDYTIHDIDFVAGFDVGENKIGKSLNEAIYE